MGVLTNKPLTTVLSTGFAVLILALNVWWLSNLFGLTIKNNEKHHPQNEDGVFSNFDHFLRRLDDPYCTFTAYYELFCMPII